MGKRLSRLYQLRQDAQALLEERSWDAQAPFPRTRRFIHFWIMVGRSFSRNRCPARASALAYATLLALIPMLAVVVSITSTFLKKEGEKPIGEFINRLVATVTPPGMLHTNDMTVATNVVVEAPADANAPPEEKTHVTIRTETTNRVVLPFAGDKKAMAARDEVVRRINEYIQKTRSGALGITGSVLLIFAAISMLSRIEVTFNDIWGVPRGRGWFTRIVLYWGVISLVPLLLVVAAGLASGPHLEATRDFLTAMPFVGKLVFQFLPIVVLCLTFSAFYLLMPNTHVDWRAGLIGGTISGVLFHLNNLLNVFYVSRVVSYSKIYGGLGLVPVFMIGLYFSWLIVLFGAQVAYAWQNRSTYLEERQIENINQRGREFIALRLLTYIGQNFKTGDAPPNACQLAEGLNVPSRLVRQILQTLAAGRLVVETAGSEGAYLPARPLDQITCHDVLIALRATRGQELATKEEPTRAEVYGEFHRIQEAERAAASSVTLQALVERAHRQLQMSSVKSVKQVSESEAN